MIAANKPALEDAYLEHIGVKGMRWGVRKDRSRGGGQKNTSNKKKIVKRVAIGAAVLAGAAATIYILRKSGKTPVH